MAITDLERYRRTNFDLTRIVWSVMEMQAGSYTRMGVFGVALRQFKLLERKGFASDRWQEF
jgi:hypothetical protein